MKFPGRRKSRHYFPVSERGRVAFRQDTDDRPPVYIAGIDQLLVDIEARADEALLQELGMPKGQSVLLDDAQVDRAYAALKAAGRIVGEFAGGAVGNTLHNYSVLADDQSYLLGSITSRMTVGDYAFHYVRNTSSRVSLSHLRPVEGPMGRAICFVTPDGERSFGVARGIMDEFPEEAVPAPLVEGAGALLLTAYLLRDERVPVYRAALRAIEHANRAGVPVVLSLGTRSLVEEKRAFLIEVLKGCACSIVAGNLDEVAALVREGDPLLAAQATLDLADLVLLTRDRHGLYVGAWTDRACQRETRDPVLSKSIPEYNRYEYSRAMPRSACTDGVRVYSHINPYLGGPEAIRNTNGAGDSALAALLHDVAANLHHRLVAPTSPKQRARFLTYSSIHQVCKYANRVSYEVLQRNSPRLVHGLPEREDSMEEAYWSA